MFAFVCRQDMITKTTIYLTTIIPRVKEDAKLTIEASQDYLGEVICIIKISIIIPKRTSL